MKSATCNLHLSDCTLENQSENSGTGGRNASEGCLRQVETVASIGNRQGKEMNSGRIQERGKETRSLTDTEFGERGIENSGPSADSGNGTLGPSVASSWETS